MVKNQRSILRLGSTAPNFDTVTTYGNLNLHNYIEGSWCLFMSHPDDFTPVCTTELAAFAKLKPDLDRRNVKVVALSANDARTHQMWIEDINGRCGCEVNFPIVADSHRMVAYDYDMLEYQDMNQSDGNLECRLTIRSVFLIDTNKEVRLILTYPATIGRSSDEILRAIDALQTTDKHGVNTPVDWRPGDEGIPPPNLSDDEVQKRFGDFRKITSYLRYVRV